MGHSGRTGVRPRGAWARGAEAREHEAHRHKVPRRADARHSSARASMAWGARAWCLAARESVAGLRGQLQDCGLVAGQSAYKCAVMCGMHVGAELCENERHRAWIVGG